MPSTIGGLYRDWYSIEWLRRVFLAHSIHGEACRVFGKQIIFVYILEIDLNNTRINAAYCHKCMAMAA